MKSHYIIFGEEKLDVADPQLDKMDAHRRDKIIERILVSFVKDTVQKNTFYGGIFDLDLANFNTMEDFKKLPLLGLASIETLQPQDLLPDIYRKLFEQGDPDWPEEMKIHQWFSSSGTTGTPKTVYYTKADWDTTMAVIIRAMQHIPLCKYNRAYIAFHMGHVGGPVFHDAINKAGGVANKKIFFYTEPDQVIQQLEKGHAKYGGYNCLAIPPQIPPGTAVKKGVTLKDLINVDKNNYIGKNIQTIITTGAPRPKELLEAVRELNDLADAPRTVFIDMAGCAEVLPTVAECEYNYLHTIPGITFTEVINAETGEHVKNGETGLLVYTGLKQGTRYIRYIVGDEATYIAEPCKCGRTTPRIGNIKRVLDKARLAGGCAAGL